MISAVRNILEDASGMTFDGFAADRRRVHSALHNFAVLGEAARHVPPVVEAARPDVPWAEMRVMRNIAVHVYHGIQLERLWDTIGNSLPPLLPQLEEMLAEIDRQEPDDQDS